MFEVLEDIISNDAEVDQLGSQSSNVQYDDLFTALNSELYPGSHYEAKKLMTKMGLGYQSIHVCKNDCALFWNENSMSETCPRLFATSKTAKLMRWHQSGKSTDDNVMRHPVDGRAWKDFDSKHTEFADDVRNVRLGLAADGFNPFNNMSISYSMWPVVLTTYNLPPWLCMKPEYLMLSLLIPGPQSPGKDMDVFKMRAALLWTVNNFPARSSLSGWSGQGYKVCPTCNENTPSMRVIGKTAYFGHRRFLPSTHRWRSNLDFDGRTDRKRPPRRFSSVDIMDQLRHVKTTIPGKHPNYGGVKRKRGDDELNWRKKSIFYELPYWAEIELKHNLDVMHIEKNICDSLLGTLMGDPHKSKDTDNARRDLQNLGIRSELHLYEDGNKLMKPAAEYTFSEANRRKFSFFDIMIHLVLHLPEEATLGGPVFMRWMYPFERYLKRLKDYVRNAAKPEGSISEGYVVDEALTFCSRYFDDIETRFNRPDRNDDGIHRTRRLFVFESQCKPMGKQSQVYVEKNMRDRAEFYILNNSPEIETYLK
ncbi:hypothetical protein UlMin_016410 [Ulmus minor]